MTVEKNGLLQDRKKTENSEISVSVNSSAYKYKNNQGKNRYIKAELPDEIADLRTKYCITGCFVLIACTALAFTLKEYRIFFLSLFGVWLIYTGIHIVFEYRNGKIQDRIAVCTGVKASRFKDETTIAFASTNDEKKEEYFQFVISGKNRTDDFLPGGYYQIYFKGETRKTLIACSGTDMNSTSEN